MEGLSFEVITDQKPLVPILNEDNPLLLTKNAAIFLLGTLGSSKAVIGRRFIVAGTHQKRLNRRPARERTTIVLDSSPHRCDRAMGTILRKTFRYQTGFMFKLELSVFNFKFNNFN